MIDVQRLSFSYSRKRPEVLHEVSFHLNAGEIAVLLGPNGVGKSTLLQCVLGILKPTEGTVLLQGMADLSPKQRAKLVAYVPQSLSFSPMSVFDAVMLGRIPHFAFVPGKEDREKVMEAIEEMGLASLMDRNVEELSGGERQKAAIARALAQEAKILVLDEPTSNLDIAAETAVLSLVRSLAKKKGMAVLVSMHEINQALTLGDRFAFLKEGCLLRYGDAEEVDEGIIESVYGVQAERVRVHDRFLFIYGGYNE